MPNIYSLLKWNRKIKSQRVKAFGIFLLHKLGKRYYGIFLDPVLACNLRCKMCYFSDEEKRKTYKGIFTEEEIDHIADAFFHRALKLQIGCGAEPTLYPDNKKIIELAKQKGIPYISMTTNGNLLTPEIVDDYVATGLNEITISMHGVTKETYEYFMTNASFEKFHAALQALSEIKKKYPSFKIRINYTINTDNLSELKYFFDYYGSYNFDILQLRPIQEIGNSEYANFSWEAIHQQYNEVINLVKKQCAEKGIVCMAPSKEDLLTESKNESSSIYASTYYYVSPRNIWQSDFDLKTEKFETYAKRTKLGRKLWKRIFEKKSGEQNKKNLNYEIG